MTAAATLVVAQPATRQRHGLQRCSPMAMPMYKRLHMMRQQQQQKEQRQRTSKYGALAIAAFGLISMLICVSGQIDGYTAGVDYPAYEAVPKGLAFNCQGRMPGYYADTATRCQVWHWCLHSGHQYSFLCPNGTVFNQAVRVCDWWSNVNCPVAEQLYENNLELYRASAGGRSRGGSAASSANADAPAQADGELQL